MTTKARPKTQKNTAAQKATMDAAREAFPKGESLKGVAFDAARTKADKAEYLQAHL